MLCSNLWSRAFRLLVPTLNQSIRIRFSSTVFLVRFWRFFTPYRAAYKAVYKATNDRFSSLFPHRVRRFFIDRASGFPSSFSHWVWEVFSPIEHTRFLSQSPTGFRRFSPPKLWSQTLTRLLELASKREGNCDVMKSYDQLCDRSNLIGTISDHCWSCISQGRLSHQSPDLSNLPTFGSTFWINFLNQPM